MIISKVSTSMEFHNRDAAFASPLPASFTFSRLAATHSCIFQCETSWSRHVNGNSCSNNGPISDCQCDHVTSAGSKSCEAPQSQRMSTQIPIWDSQCSAPRTARIEKHSEVLGRPFQYPHRDDQLECGKGSGHYMAYNLSPMDFSSSRPKLTNAKLLPPASILSPNCDPNEPARKSVVSCPSTASFLAAAGLQDLYPPRPRSAGNAHAHDTGEVSNPALSCSERGLACKDTSCGWRRLHNCPGSKQLRPRAGRALFARPGPDWDDQQAQPWCFISSSNAGTVCSDQPITPLQKSDLRSETSSSEESVEQAVTAPRICRRHAMLTSVQQLTTVSSPSKPRLIIISPRTPTSKSRSLRPTTPLECCAELVPAFNPDTPPKTPDAANRIKANEHPTYSMVGKYGYGSLDSKIGFPITPPNLRVPTPSDEFTPSCLRKRPRWGQSTTAHYDPSTTWILQELEVLLADFPRTVLRIQSPVIQRIRSFISNPPIVERSPVGQQSATALHSRYSPHRPVANPGGSTRKAGLDHPPQRTRASRNIQADPTMFALRTVFPRARSNHLDSLHATYLALHYVASLPSSAASASDATASPFNTSREHSRSSSVVSNVPSKARAMLGLEPPVQISPLLPLAAKSRIRASSRELHPGLKARLEDVELVLETSVRKILVEIEGRSLATPNGALVRAVGEIIRMGEQRSSARAS